MSSVCLSRVCYSTKVIERERERERGREGVMERERERLDFTNYKIAILWFVMFYINFF